MSSEVTQTVLGEFQVQYIKQVEGGKKKQPKSPVLISGKVASVMSLEGAPKEARVAVYNETRPAFAQLLDSLLMSEQVLSLPPNHTEPNQRWGVQLTRLDLPEEEEDDAPSGGEDDEKEWKEDEEGTKEVAVGNRREVTIFFSTDAQRASFLAHVGFSLYAAVSTLEDVSFSVERPRPSTKVKCTDGDTVSLTVLATIATPTSNACKTKTSEMKLDVQAPTSNDDRKKMTALLEVTKHSPASLHSLLVSAGAAPGQIFITTGRVSNEGSWVASVINPEDFDSNEPIAFALAVRFESTETDKGAAIRRRLERQGAIRPGSGGSFGGSFAANASFGAAAARVRAGSQGPGGADSGTPAADNEKVSEVPEETAPPPPPIKEEEVEEVLESPTTVAKKEKKSKKERRMLEEAIAAETLANAMEGGATSVGAADEEDVSAGTYQDQVVKAKLDKKKQKLKDYEVQLTEHAAELTKSQAELELAQDALDERQVALEQRAKALTIAEDDFCLRVAALDAREQQINEKDLSVNSKAKKKEEKDARQQMQRDESGAGSLGQPLLGGAPTNGGYGDEGNYAFRVKYGYYDQDKLPSQCTNRYFLASLYVHFFTRAPVVAVMDLLLLGATTAIMWTEEGRNNGWPAAAFCVLVAVNLSLCFSNIKKYFEKLQYISQVDAATAAVGQDRGHQDLTLSSTMSKMPLFQYVATIEGATVVFWLLSLAPVALYFTMTSTFNHSAPASYQFGALVGVCLSILTLGAVIVFFAITCYTGFERIKLVVPIHDYGSLDQRVLMRTAMATYQHVKTEIQVASAAWQGNSVLTFFILLAMLLYSVYNALLNMSPFKEHAILVAIFTFFIATLISCFFFGCLTRWDRATLDLVGNVSIHADRWSRGDFSVSKSHNSSYSPPIREATTPRDGTPKPGEEGNSLLPNSGGKDATSVKVYGSPNQGIGVRVSTQAQNAKDGRSDVVISDFIYLQEFFAHTVTGRQHAKWYLLWVSPRHGVARWSMVVSRYWLYVMYVFLLVSVASIPVAIFYTKDR